MTVVVCLFDTLAWAVVAFATFFSGSDPATRELDEAAGVAVTALFLLTAAPAMLLTWRARAPRTALTLALAFPAVFALLFAIAVVGWAV